MDFQTQSLLNHQRTFCQDISYRKYFIYVLPLKSQISYYVKCLRNFCYYAPGKTRHFPSVIMDNPFQESYKISDLTF